MQYPIWYKQSGFRFAHQERIIYIDPWEVPEEEPKADFILITHEHFDHFDPKTIERLRTPRTIIVAPPDVLQKLSGDNLIAISPNQQRTIKSLEIEAVPAYNLDKTFHPKENGWVGYVLNVNGTRFYHAGDTDHILEMAAIRCDVAMLPIGGTYTMDIEEAAEAARTLRPKKVTPMHYGFIVGSRDDGARLSALLPGKVAELEPRAPFER